MRRLLLYCMMLGMVVSWHRVTFHPGGKIQYLCLKDGGKYISYFDTHNKKITSVIDSRTHTTSQKHVVDTDIQKWNNTVYSMVAYYDSVHDSYRVSGTNVSCASPVKRSIFVSKPYSLSRLIFTQMGRWFNFTTTIDGDYICTVNEFPFHVCAVEYYPPNVYIIDSHYGIHMLYEDGTLVGLKDVDCRCPVAHLHVYRKSLSDNPHMTIGFINRTVLQFDVINQTAMHLCCFITENVLKVYADPVKTLVVTDKGDVLVYDNHGRFLHRIRDVCDPDYVTRVYGSESCFMVDGTDGIVAYRQEEKKVKKSGFLGALMKTPVFNIEHLRGNWSFENDS